MLKRISKSAVIAVAVIGLSNFNQSAAENSARKLNDSEIKSALSGKSFYFSGAKVSGEITFTSSSFKGVSAKGVKFTGTWRTKGGQYCFQNSFGNSGCSTVFRGGNGILKMSKLTYTPK